MKNLSASPRDKGSLTTLCLLVTISVLGLFVNNAMFSRFTLLLFIPTFLIAYFSKNKKLGFAFITFLLFSFLGDASCLFFKEDMLVKASGLLYLLGYVYLIISSAPKFKFTSIDKLVGTYLISVLLIALFFLYSFIGVLKFTVNDSIELTLFGAKCLSVIILAFVAFGVYLGTQTKSSVLFLIAVMCLTFSVVLNYVSMYYLYNAIFVVIERIMYALSLFLLFRYAALVKEEALSLGMNKAYKSSKNVLA